MGLIALPKGELARGHVFTKPLLLGFEWDGLLAVTLLTRIYAPPG